MTPQAVNRHLVEIYILLCRAGLNKDYYGYILHRTQNLSTWMDIFIAIGTTGSSISALTIWTTDYGKYIWGFFTAISTALAVIKPVIKLNTKIEQLSKLFVGHSEVYNNMIVLISRAKRQNSLTDEMINSFQVSEQKFLELSKDDAPHPNLKLLKRCDDAIREKHPPERAWYLDEQKSALNATEVRENSEVDSMPVSSGA